MPDPVSVSLQSGLWNPSTHRFTISGPTLNPGDTLLLLLTSQGAYSNVDSGPLAGQYDTTINLITQTIVQFLSTQTRCFTDGQIADWPDPAVVGPYLVTIEPGVVPWQEVMTVTAVVPADFYIDVIRGTTPVTHPSNSVIIVNDPVEIVDSGNQPPLLYVPGDPTAAPARTAAWWAQVNASGGTPDPSFALWQSRYWQSAPTLPSGHPLWSTLSMLARRVDGTEVDIGMFDPITGEMVVEMLGALPTDYTFLHAAYLLTLTPTIEILPLPESLGDLLQAADPTPSIPPDPGYPPFAWVYPASSWSRWISSVGMNDADIFLPVLLSQWRAPSGPAPRPGIEGFRDVTGDDTFDNPVSLPLNRRGPAGGGLYSVVTQVGLNIFTATHDPNPIIDEVLRLGTVDLATEGSITSGSPGQVGYPGTSRVPVVGQDPWWELAGLKAGALELGSGGTVQPPTGDVRTDDVMLVVAQSDGLAAPADPEGWTRIDALCGPNAYSAQEVTVSTTLALDALAGSAFISVNLITLLPLPPIPFPLVCDGESMTASTAVIGGDGVELGVGSVGSDHLAGAPVTMQGDPPIMGRDQYVAAWWKIAAGPPPVDGVPSFATETGPTITFPDASSCSAQLFAIMCDLTNPFSQISPGLDAVSRADFPAPAHSVTTTDMLPEDGITLRAGFGLLMGQNCRQSTPTTSIRAQDILYDTWATAEIDPSPILAWQEVGPDTVGVALYLMFRGHRERPAYEKVDGHYAPTFLNHGVLPPCTGSGVFGSDDYRQGFGIQKIFAGFHSSSSVLVQHEGLFGSTAYLHAWLWSDTTVPEVTGYIYQRSSTGAIINQTTWFTSDAFDSDTYIDPPGDPAFYTGDNPYCFRVEIAAGSRGTGYLGVNAWNEESCQEPADAVFGLTAGFHYRALAPPASPSNQQPSIVG